MAGDEWLRCYRVKEKGKSRRSGFTLIELLTVVLMIGILAGLCIPNLHRTIVKARATSILGDLHVIRVAIYNHLADQDTWPRDASRGLIPGTLRPYLPEGFSFRTDVYTLDYDNFSGSRQSSGSFYIGVTVIVMDMELGQELLRLLSGSRWSDREPRFTVLPRAAITQ